ncbi:hypothetical protein [Streptomyces meridianus]|uniref:DUF2867 domain-containing protein n=1 Tax=Streptomyces meridianus TaxID=2938945 RepID=A0ABT0WZY6_9ACTN|nr:hypothetical protein [Streptomyces meridianus]MCM2575875.1 hypothetical protein [Streptomyces meridianus]
MGTTDGCTDGTETRDGLPFVDEHTVLVPAPRPRVWAALESPRVTSLRLTEGGLPARMLGTSPPAGFEVAQSSPPERLALAGRHRFSRYLLVFELADTGDGGTRLAARTFAAFPGARGRLYRVLVIGTRIHVLATRRILRSVRRLSVEPTAPGDPAA